MIEVEVEVVAVEIVVVFMVGRGSWVIFVVVGGREGKGV